MKHGYKTVFTINKPYQKPINKIHETPKQLPREEVRQLIENYSIIYGAFEKDITIKTINLNKMETIKELKELDEFHLGQLNNKRTIEAGGLL